MCTTDGEAVVVEWADRTPEAMPETTAQVCIEPIGAQSRRLTLSGIDPACEHLAAVLTASAPA